MKPKDPKKTLLRRLDQEEKKPIEIAAERLAEILIAQIEFNKNKDKDAYEKRR